MTPFYKKHLNILAAGLLLVTLGASLANAAMRRWTPKEGIGWNTPGNWSPDGVPRSADEVIADREPVLLLDVNADVKNLTLAKRAAMLVDGFRLSVTETLQINDRGTALLLGEKSDGDGLSVGRLKPHGGLVLNEGLRANRLELGGGQLLLNGGVAAVTDTVVIRSGEIAGHGQITITGDLEHALHNNGSIIAEGGTLEFISSTGGFDLHGDTGLGTVHVSNGSELIISGELLTCFQGTFTINADGHANLADWCIGQNGVVTLNGGEISGGPMTVSGELRGHGVVATTQLVIRSLIAASGGTLRLVSEDPIQHYRPEARIEAIDGDIEIIGPNRNSNFYGQLTVGEGHVLDTGNTGFVMFNNARVDLSGGTLIASALHVNPDSTAVIATEGSVPSRLELKVSSDWSGTVELGADLHVSGSIRTEASLNVTGPGRLILEDAIFESAAGTHIASRVVNQGILRPGRAESTGRLTMGDDYQQRESGQLKIDIAGTDAFDTLVVATLAILDGEIIVQLSEGFVPTAGMTFPVLTADSVIGAFAKADLPAGFVVEYEPGRVVLRVIRPVCDCNAPNAILGTDGPDTLTGTEGSDIICGLKGNDIIRGLGGNDCLLGGDGRDQLFGGPGDDELLGGRDRDFLDGGDGTNECNGGPGDDDFKNCANK